MKKYFYSVLVMALFAIGFAASDDSESSVGDVPETMEAISAESMLSDLEKNQMRAQKKYKGNWYEISGKLGNMDSDGDYFSLEGDGFRMIDVHCKLPGNKKEELTKKLLNMENGDHVTVKGKVTDVGEVMGFRVTVDDLH